MAQQQGRSGPRLGTSVLSSERSPRPFSDSRGYGKGRLRGDQFEQGGPIARGPGGAVPMQGQTPELAPDPRPNPADRRR
jgi:hypothetical protein